jgi:hypothetical protein
MGAWSVGKEAGRGPEGFTADDGNANPIQAALDNLTKWIPGEAIALYAAAVTAISTGVGKEPSIPLLVAFVIVSFALVVLAAFSTGTVTKKVLIAAALAAVAFTVWALSVPNSGWQKWDVVANNRAEVGIAAAVTALLFGLLAEGIMRRVH